MELAPAIFSVKCDEREGEIVRYVRESQLSIPKLRFYWEKLRQFPTLFGRHIQSIEDFFDTFIYIDEYGKVNTRGLIWDVDDVGIIYITDIQPNFQAVCHFTFWDRRLKGRGPLLKEAVNYVFKEFGFHRLMAKIPAYAKPAMFMAESIGFVWEGRLRKYTWYKGEWWDVNLYSVLREEALNGIPGPES